MPISETPPGQGAPPAQTAAPSGAATTSTPTTAPEQPRTTTGQFAPAPTEWRYPADYHIPELRGRTGEEAGNYFKTFYSQALATQQPRPQPQAAPQPQTAMPDDTEWLTNPNTAFQRATQNVMQNQLQPTLSAVFQSNAQTNRALVAQRYPDVFEKWAPEVDALALQLDPQYRTYENLERIVKMVRSDHNDEIVQAKLDAAVQARITAMGGSLRSDGSPVGASAAQPVGVDLTSNELPEEYRQVLASVNMKPRDLPDFLRRYYGQDVDLDKAMKDWFEKAKSGKVISESRAGWRMERK